VAYAFFNYAGRVWFFRIAPAVGWAPFVRRLTIVLFSPRRYRDIACLVAGALLQGAVVVQGLWSWARVACFCLPRGRWVIVSRVSAWWGWPDSTRGYSLSDYFLDY